MSFLGFLWRFGKTQRTQQEETKSLSELVEEYRSIKSLLSFVAYDHNGNVPEDHFFMRNLHELEQQIIAHILISDRFYGEVLRIFARYKFDITDFLSIDEFEENARKYCRAASHFLEYGAPYPTESDFPETRLPISGKEVFFWLLCQAKGSFGEDRLRNILEAVRRVIDAGEVLGEKFDKGLCDWAMRFGMPFLSPEWAYQTRVLVDVLCELEEGEIFIRRILDLASAKTPS